MTIVLLLQALGWAIMNSLWQLALLWVLYQLCLFIYPAMKAAARSRLASGLLLGGFVWFLFTLFSGLGHKASLAEAFSLNSEKGSLIGTINDTIHFLIPYASILYLALLTLPILRFIRNYRYVKVIRQNGLHKIAAEYRLFVDHIAGHMGIHQKVQVWVSEWVSSPVTIGFLKPVILIPMAAVNHLSPSQMEAVLIHELAHIQKMDYLVNLLMNMVKVILYFNPFSNAFIRIVETEREKNCDEMVLQFQYGSHDYASALLMLEKLNCRHQVLVLAATGKNDLLNRVENMMGLEKKHRFGKRRTLAFIAGLLAIFFINALSLLSKQVNTEPSPVYSNRLERAGVNELASIRERPEKIATEAIRQTALPGIPTSPEDLKICKPAPAPAPGLPDAAYRTVSFTMPDIAQVVLNKTQDIQVKQAMASSKKILENVQLMQMEKNLADAFSQKEKEELKVEWRNEMEKFDWSKLEHKLRASYAQVDWDRVNLQLNSAIRQIQVDSLVNVYNKAMTELAMVQKQMNEDSLTAIPDTDVTLTYLADKQNKIRKALEQLKPSTKKKTIRL